MQNYKNYIKVVLNFVSFKTRIEKIFLKEYDWFIIITICILINNSSSALLEN